MQITYRSTSTPETYEEARTSRIFNHRRPKRYPLAIIHAKSPQDIVSAVKLAKENQCRIAIRSGGHSWATWSIRDESILLDLGNFKCISVDAENRTAVVSTSVTGRELNGKLVEKFGLMFPGGHCPDVGLGGFLLQGGMGWNCRGWGWACERVKGIDVVTAEGKELHCNAGQNEDLYWAARGSGPGFPAIITTYHLSLTPYPRNGFRSSGYLYPLSKYTEAFNWIINITPSFDIDTEIVAVGLTPEDRNEICLFILLVTLKHTPEEAYTALLPAQNSRPQGTLSEWFCAEDSLSNQYTSQANANPEGHRYCVDNGYLHNDADVPSILKNAFTELPTTKSFALWYGMNPCSRRPLPDMALSMQSDHYFALYTVWEDEGDDDRCQNWVRGVMKEVERHSTGAYLGDSDFQERQTRYWAPSNGKKLNGTRKKWDPEGRICGYLDRGDSSGVEGLGVHKGTYPAQKVGSVVSIPPALSARLRT
ncbi:FAD-binding oxidoreductase [Aspergillus stella-maris]|uniref:FAD-binding oxidoreductase n=1 Tax=Aspergillus stella-maris TaxID=1810926 RepID=UPI003CCDFF9F